MRVSGANYQRDYGYLRSLPQLPDRILQRITQDYFWQPTEAEERELSKHVWRIARMIRAARDGLSDEQRRDIEEYENGSD